MVVINEKYIIGLYVLAAISTTSTASVIVTLLRNGSRNISSHLIFILHLYKLVEEISSLPNVYEENEFLCLSSAYFRVFASFGGVLASLFMVVTTYQLLFATLKASAKMELSGKISGFLLLFPAFVAVLPFSSNSYGVEYSHWCSFNHSPAGKGMAIGFYSLTSVVLLLSFSILCLIIWKVRKGSGLRYKIQRTLGLYVFITVCCWTPRTLLRFPAIGNPGAKIFIGASFSMTFIGGILYACMFAFEKRALERFEAYYRQQKALTEESSMFSLLGDGDDDDCDADGGVGKASYRVPAQDQKMTWGVSN
jgi:hypothetical protein